MSWVHTKASCNQVQHQTEGGPSIGCQMKEGSGMRGKYHHWMLHGSQSALKSVLQEVEQGSPGQNPQEYRDCRLQPPGRPDPRSPKDPPQAEHQRGHDQRAPGQGGREDGNRPNSSVEAPRGGEREANGDSGRGCNEQAPPDRDRNPPPP